MAEALKLKGAEVYLWHTCDFPSQSLETISFSNQSKRLSIEDPGGQLRDPSFTSVWYRRPTDVLPEAVLHPADRQFALIECRSFRRGLFEVLAPDAFWVNSPDAATRASRKVYQISTARSLGFTIPDTLFTNDPEEIRSFIDLHGGQVVTKAFAGVPWQDEETYWVPFTSLLTKDLLVEDILLRAVPGIFQAVVPKAYELRVTVMGRHVLGAKILSQQTSLGKLDWRKAYSELKMESCKLPKQVEELCIRMLEDLGLVFGCFDFVVTPDGNHVFLEVNEMGQFLFVEHYTGAPLLDAFSELLLQGRADFTWDSAHPRIKYKDVEQKVQQMAAEFSGIHVPVPDGASWEGGAPLKNPAEAR